MTIYEQMQSAVDYIEDNLFTALRVHRVTEHVHMSARSFYIYFWSVCGFSYKEYVIKRRLAESLPSLEERHEKIIDIGSFQASADIQRTIPLSPILGGLSLVGGIVLVIIGRKKS